jgi:hypothetical protein
MDIREIGWGSVDWIQLAQDRDRWIRWWTFWFWRHGVVRGSLPPWILSGAGLATDVCTGVTTLPRITCQRTLVLNDQFLRLCIDWLIASAQPVRWTRLQWGCSVILALLQLISYLTKFEHFNILISINKNEATGMAEF